MVPRARALDLARERKDQIVAPERVTRTHGLSAPLGVALVVLGSICCAIAALQFSRYVRTLPADSLPPRYSTLPAVGLTLGLATVGVILAIYLSY